MDKAIGHIVIVGGGSAGLLTAGILAAQHPDRSDAGLKISLIESPDIATIGVGEGTWPTMRQTLSKIGISERQLLACCDASFKQGSCFAGWRDGASDDIYIHPFETPIKASSRDLIALWQQQGADVSFAQAVCPQAAGPHSAMAPKQSSMPQFAGALNYGYHLDAVKLAALLRDHIQEALGVTYISAHVTAINSAKDGAITSVVTAQHGEIAGDFFIDCTGQKSLLLGQHYGVKFLDQSSVLFNDRALAVHLPVDAQSEVNAYTRATAHKAGWIWDIGLPLRRGIGCVYASSYLSDDEAYEVLENYISTQPGGKQAESLETLSPRLLKFTSGYRQEFWHKNCLAIGMSAGFLEPLEASALVMVELSAQMLSDNLPVNTAMMTVMSKRFNARFSYRWRRVVDFLKLHYVLSKRDDPYWRDNCEPSSMTESLRESLELWTHQPPSADDFDHAAEIFPTASYQYVLYGMDVKPSLHPTYHSSTPENLEYQIEQARRKQRQLLDALPSNRTVISTLNAATE